MSKTQEQIWQSVKGSDELYAIYGYYPTLHDANIVNFDVRFEAKEISLTFEYDDLVERSAGVTEQTEDSAVKIILCWRGVNEAKFCLDSNDIYHFEFRRAGKYLETIFIHSSGIENYILAESVSLISVNPSGRDSVRDVNDYLHTVNFTFAG